MDTIKYELYAKAEHYNVVYDKLDKTFAIHTKDLDSEKPMIVGFDTAAKAMEFAENRVVSIEKDAGDTK